MFNLFIQKKNNREMQNIPSPVWEELITKSTDLVQNASRKIPIHKKEHTTKIFESI
jgi:hypothetical protein